MPHEGDCYCCWCTVGSLNAGNSSFQENNCYVRMGIHLCQEHWLPPALSASTPKSWPPLLSQKANEIFGASCAIQYKLNLRSFILIALTQIQLTQTRDNRRAATIHRAHLGSMLVSVLPRHPYGGWTGERPLWWEPLWWKPAADTGNWTRSLLLTTSFFGTTHNSATSATQARLLMCNTI
jgi:hypothetical protein